DFFSFFSVPDPDRLVEAGAGDPSPVRAEDDTMKILCVPLEYEHICSRGGVPDAHRPVRSTRGEALAIGAPSQGAPPVFGWKCESEDFLARIRVPELDRSSGFFGDRCQPFAVGAEGSFQNPAGVALQHSKAGAGSGIE